MCIVIKASQWTTGKLPTCQSMQHERGRFDPWVGKILWRRAWQPTSVLFPGEFHGQRSLVGYNPWGCKELDMTEATQHVCCHKTKAVCVCVRMSELKNYIHIHIHLNFSVHVCVCVRVYMFTISKIVLIFGIKRDEDREQVIGFISRMFIRSTLVPKIGWKEV